MSPVAEELDGRNIGLTRVVPVVALVGFACAYAVYALIQYSDAFFEASFLHFPFLMEFVDTGSIRDFFTVFGEHLVPAYNIILTLNYYLFHLWGGFDTIIFSLVLGVSAVLLCHELYIRRPESVVVSICSVLTTGIMLSPINNVMWGMALGAQIGTLLLIVMAIILSRAYSRSATAINPIFFAILPPAILLFLGGYSIGVVAAVLAGIIVWLIRTPRAIGISLVIVTVLVVSLSLYVYLVVRGHGFDGEPDLVEGSAGPLKSVEFAVLMIGASVLGNATREAGSGLLAYYICGGALLAGSLAVVCRLVVGGLRKELDDKEVLLGILLAHALSIVALVSIARLSNGIEGGLGNWYVSHTKFIPLSVVFFASRWLSQPRRPWFAVIGAGGIVIIGLAGFVAGYRFDFVKAPYVKTWKDNFDEQALVVLRDGVPVKDRGNVANTMLWNYTEDREAVSWMYKKSAWIFDSPKPIVRGLTSDGWLQTDQALSIMCPTGSHSIQFDVIRPPSWPDSVLSLNTDGATSEWPVREGVVGFPLPSIAVLSIDASNLAKSKPETSPPDLRSLVMHAAGIVCG